MKPHPHRRRERSEHYGGVIFRQSTPSGSFRVIVCRDGIQWILQRRSAGTLRAATGRWEAIGHVATRAGLIRLWRARIGAPPAELNAFPDHVQQAEKFTLMES